MMGTAVCGTVSRRPAGSQLKPLRAPPRRPGISFAIACASDATQDRLPSHRNAIKPQQTRVPVTGSRHRVAGTLVRQPDPSPTRKVNPMSNDATKRVARPVSGRPIPLTTPTDLKDTAAQEITAAMNGVLADVFALYLKTKNFHWHMSGPHFRDYHLLLDEQADQLFAMTDPVAERIRKIGGTTLRSIGHIARIQRIRDNDADYVEPLLMLTELCDDNKALTARLREAHGVCENDHDIATASLIEVWIDETERRTWFLFEAVELTERAKH
jgi:starvation-inducible DNA-binding protein